MVNFQIIVIFLLPYWKSIFKTEKISLTSWIHYKFKWNNIDYI